MSDKILPRIEFSVDGDPKPQPRLRAFARKMGDKFVARVYDAGTAEGWKSLIALAAKEHMPFVPMPGPISLEAHFFFARPKHHFTKKGLRPTAAHYHTVKPDTDNLVKALKDCMTTLGAWSDDAQVCMETVTKQYGPKPGVLVIIEPLSIEPPKALEIAND